MNKRLLSVLCLICLIGFINAEIIDNGDESSLTCIEQPFCGNEILELGEQCDWGELNGFLCWAGYGSSCTYCSSTCELKTITNYCGDGILNSACEECDDGNSVSGDGCSSLCKIEEEPEPPVCTHDVAIRYSYSNSYGTGIAVGYGNGTWISEEIVNLKEGNYKIKYFIDNKKEADDNVSITIKLDNITLSGYNQLINSYHSKQLDLNTSQLCGTHTISIEVESDGDECNLSDNHASRQIYAECENPPEPPVCGDRVCNGEETCSTCPSDCGVCPPQQPICGDGLINQVTEQCDDGNLANGDGCTNICEIEDDDNKVRKNTGFIQFCEPNWKCSGWSECNDEIMTRKCTDINNCDFSYNKPAEKTICEQRALIKGEENNVLLWVMIGMSLFILIFLMMVIFSVRRKKLVNKKVK